MREGTEGRLGWEESVEELNESDGDCNSESVWQGNGHGRSPMFFCVCSFITTPRGREREIVEETKGWLAFIE